MTTRLMMAMMGLMVMMVGPVAAEEGPPSDSQPFVEPSQVDVLINPYQTIECVAQHIGDPWNTSRIPECLADSMCGECHWCVAYRETAISPPRDAGDIEEMVYDLRPRSNGFGLEWIWFGPSPYSNVQIDSQGGWRATGKASPHGEWMLSASLGGNVVCDFEL